MKGDGREKRGWEDERVKSEESRGDGREERGGEFGWKGKQRREDDGRGWKIVEKIREGRGLLTVITSITPRS